MNKQENKKSDFFKTIVSVSIGGVIPLIGAYFLYASEKEDLHIEKCKISKYVLLKELALFKMKATYRVERLDKNINIAEDAEIITVSSRAVVVGFYDFFQYLSDEARTKKFYLDSKKKKDDSEMSFSSSVDYFMNTDFERRFSKKKIAFRTLKSVNKVVNKLVKETRKSSACK
jgi:hypothetical protein